jgi:hypothetical protein
MPPTSQAHQASVRPARIGLALMTAAMFCSPTRAIAEEAARHVIVRSHFGVGHDDALSSGHDGGLSEHGGGRLLLQANQFQRYGLEMTALRLNVDRRHSDYIGTGIVLEQVLWGWFNMGIGTIGYLRTSGGSPHPFGIVTNLAYERWLTPSLQVFAAYRSEWLFSEPVVAASSASIGIAVGI